VNFPDCPTSRDPLQKSLSLVDINVKMGIILWMWQVAMVGFKERMFGFDPRQIRVI
jgi:hypothetical protein